MYVFRRKGSPFYYTEFKIKGHRFSRCTEATTEREAKSAARQLKATEQERLKQAPAASALTVDQGFERYWQEHGQKLAWASEVDRYIVQILSRIDRAQLIEDLTDAEVNDFVQARVGEGGGSYAINRALAVWRGMHNRARKRWKQKTQVIDWSDFRNPEKEITRYITLEEARRLLAELALHVALAVEWSLYTGCREAETYGLRWDKIHMDRGYATVIAKGGREHSIWLTEQTLDLLTRCPRNGPLVFDRTNKRKLFARGLERAGIENFRWHDLRHTHAQWLRDEAGAGLDIVQRSLGHKKLSTTMRYLTVADRKLLAALRRLPSICTAAPLVVRHPAADSTG